MFNFKWFLNNRLSYKRKFYKQRGLAVTVSAIIVVGLLVYNTTIHSVKISAFTSNVSAILKLPLSFKASINRSINSGSCVNKLGNISDLKNHRGEHACIII